ncbi:hypothetical protein F4859DRAFT_483198 [Xylaria cf. heliscus]|nr:hypothetical protein F4859DRAFT_483198 [Xylaria cf. heliscus]
MPEILRFRSTWGVDPGDGLKVWREWFPTLKEKGYTGVEIDFAGLEDLSAVRRLADESGLEIIALAHSQWPKYVGPRPVGATAKDHLKSYREQLELAQILRPFKINVHSGSDHWPLDESIKFYQGTLEIDAQLGLTNKVTHETHRLRSFYNPYSTTQILSQVASLRITTDISHWTCVCERLINAGLEDDELLNQIIPKVEHIHARIGTTQSSQCPDPTNPVFKPEREFFEGFWKRIITAASPDKPVTFTPEYGPYPYHPFGSARDFSELADSEGARLQLLFEKWADESH